MTSRSSPEGSAAGKWSSSSRPISTGRSRPSWPSASRPTWSCATPASEYVEQIRVTGQLAATATRDLELHPDRDALLATFRGFSRTIDS